MAEQAEQLRTKAAQCRRLARSITDERAIDALLGLASEYEQRAATPQVPRSEAA